MQKKTLSSIVIATVLLVVSIFPLSVSQVNAAATVSIQFAADGFSNYDGVVLTIDGSEYDIWTLPWTTFVWEKGSTHTVAATTPFTDGNNNIYRFSSWTNGDGLAGASGTYTTPNQDKTVTAHYEVASVTVTFATSGISNVNDDILTIDGTGYNYWSIPSFKWEKSSTHTVTAETPLTGWDTKVYGFVDWTNGNGLTGASGTFTTPETDTTVTANYAIGTVDIQFTTSTLSTFTGGVVLTIDSVGYDYWDLPSTHFTWQIGSMHNIVVSTPLTGWDDTVYEFSSWTNGNGLSGTSGTYAVPGSDAVVTANYVSSSSPAVTSLTISVIPETVDKTGTDSGIITGFLTSSGSGVQGKTITLSYFDGVSWNQIGTNSTGADGAYQYSWDVPESLANGQYALKAEFAGDSNYEASSATTGQSGNGGNLFVVPEYLWGGLAALFACFGAFVLFKKHDSLSSLVNKSKFK
ncbi:MAG: hypothetical protein NWF05_02570 [Candidatus Bathyarchaeota archaeon]|nr:hypothetical protein [Candidatus Bathyarchaeota archaeon]